MFEPYVKLNGLEFSEEDVHRYEQQPVEENMILLYGSSSFTRWSAPRYGYRPVEDEIRGKNGEKVIVNHGFGTSTMEELLYYYPRLVRPWKPRVLVINGFINDNWRGYSVEETIFLFKRLVAYARTDMPGIRFFIADIHPSAKHVGDKGHYAAYRRTINAEVEQYCREHDDCTFVCHRTSPLFYANAEDVGDYDKARTDIFVADGMHFTQEGYDIYREFWREALKDVL